MAMPLLCMENLKFTNGGLGVASTDSGASITADLTDQESDDAQFRFISSDGSSIEEKFAFTASLPAQQPMLSLRRQHKRKYKLKIESVSGTTSASDGSTLSNKPRLSRMQGQPGDITTSESMDKHGTERIKEQESESALSAAKKACDKWRKRPKFIAPGIKPMRRGSSLRQRTSIHEVLIVSFQMMHQLLLLDLLCATIVTMLQPGWLLVG